VKILTLLLLSLNFIATAAFADPPPPNYPPNYGGSPYAGVQQHAPYGAPYIPPPLYVAPYRSAGCGLGSMWIKSEGFAQVFAATTNNSFGTQTFGISSGTSNCGRPGGYATREAEQQMYIEANFDQIQMEIAQGSGEHLNNIASLMGCSENAEAYVAAVMKSKENLLAQTNSDQLLGALKSAAVCGTRIVKN
jgi:Protein of unknown function (DUF3015)